MGTEENKTIETVTADLNAALDLIEEHQWSGTRYEDSPCCPSCGASADDLDDPHHIHKADCETALFLRAHGREVQIADPEAREQSLYYSQPEQTICFFSPGSFPAEEGPVDLLWLMALAQRALKDAVDPEIRIIMSEKDGQLFERAVRIMWPPAPEREGLPVPACCVDLEPCENGHAFKVRGMLGYLVADGSTLWARLNGAPVFALPWNTEWLETNTAMKVDQAMQNMGQRILWKTPKPCTGTPGPVCSKGVAP